MARGWVQPGERTTSGCRLPVGFAYVAGSARLDGQAVANPTGGAGPLLTWPITSPLAVRNSLLSGSEKTVLFMSSSYETWEESATQDKRKGRRTALATSDDF